MQNLSTTRHFIIGVDEVGRGPLLGDVVVAAVVLPNTALIDRNTQLTLSNLTDAHLLDEVGICAEHPLATLADSKKLSEPQREALWLPIQTTAIASRVVKIPPTVIDEINILQATLRGMTMAIQQVIEQINKQHEQPILPTFTVLVDGNRLPSLKHLAIYPQITQQRSIIKGDNKHASISAASVLAKVSRDRDMYALATRYPNYGIEQHKGYPTVKHLQALKQFGVLPEHRRSFAPVMRQLQLTNPA